MAPFRTHLTIVSKEASAPPITDRYMIKINFRITSFWKMSFMEIELESNHLTINPIYSNKRSIRSSVMTFSTLNYPIEIIIDWHIRPGKGR